MAIGDRIREVRNRAQMSQEELARRAGMSLNGVAILERGVRKDPHVSTLSKLAEALDVPVIELLEETSSPKALAPQLN
jgi:transcriptional regulator with XRE-family HTH domain